MSEFKVFLFGQLYFAKNFITFKTPLYHFIETPYQDIRRDSLIKKLTMLEDIISMQEKPKFVYAHFLIPHEPHSFDENGNPFPLQTKKQSFEEWIQEGYIQSIKFINKKISPIIDKILKQSPTPPIIILQGDHGTWFPKNYKSDHFKILNAYYFPDGGNKLLYPTIQPINNFRLVFNYYFGTNFPLLKQKLFWGIEDDLFKKLSSLKSSVK